MTTSSPPRAPEVPRAARAVARQWRGLVSPYRGPAHLEPSTLDALPAAVLRWLGHAILPTARPSTTLAMQTSGHVDLDGWRAFSADHVIRAGEGFIWAARLRKIGLPLTGVDAYTGGAGLSRWKFANAFTLRGASDDDVRMSTLGRLASELPLTPAAALSPWVTWEDLGPNQALARVLIDEAEHQLTVDVDSTGRVTSCRLLRWGDPEGGHYSAHHVRLIYEGEREVDGYRIPERVRGTWDPDSRRSTPLIDMTIGLAQFI